MALKDIDLNLLRVLDVLLKEQNVTRAAAKLNLTQSAASSSLKRLRVAFGDELLVLVGRQMHLTPRAEALRPSVAAIIAQIEDVISPEAFEPTRSERNFVIASADYTTLTLVPALLALIRREAPGMRIKVLDLGERTMPELAAGRIDAIVAPRSALSSAGLRSRSLFSERLVCVAARRHRAIKGRIDSAAFRSLPHVLYQPGRDTSVSAAAMQLRKQRIDVDVLATCPSFASLAFMVGATDAIALLQERLAQKFEKPAQLQILPPPVKTEPLDIALFWTANQNSDPAHKWMRAAIAKAGHAI